MAGDDPRRMDLFVDQFFKAGINFMSGSASAGRFTGILRICFSMPNTRFVFAVKPYPIVLSFNAEPNPNISVIADTIFVIDIFFDKNVSQFKCGDFVN